MSQVIHSELPLHTLLRGGKFLQTHHTRVVDQQLQRNTARSERCGESINRGEACEVELIRREEKRERERERERECVCVCVSEAGRTKRGRDGKESIIILCEKSTSENSTAASGSNPWIS